MAGMKKKVPMKKKAPTRKKTASKIANKITGGAMGRLKNKYSNY